MTGGFVGERVTGIEPALSAWEADVLAIELHPRARSFRASTPYQAVAAVMSRAADADRAASRTSDDTRPEGLGRPRGGRSSDAASSPNATPASPSSLQYAELTLVTLGWIVILQVGVVMLDRFRYGQLLGPDKRPP